MSSPAAGENRLTRIPAHTRARDPRGEYKLVFLPGLYKVAKLLNGTTGVRAVTSSRISRALAATPDLITDDDAQLSYFGVPDGATVDVADKVAFDE